MNCLNCQSEFEVSLTFKQLFFLERPTDPLCDDCMASFEKIAEPHCPCCYRKGSKETCSDCLYWLSQSKFVNHRAIYSYNQAMKDYFSRYKFYGDYVLRELFGKEIKKALRHYPGYAIVPIPVSSNREQERGFNQVTGLLEAAGVSYRNLLTKQEGQKQSEKSREERLQTKNPFQVIKEETLPERIVIVDDIYTTGATIQLATACFLENGVKEIKSFSLAR